MPKDTAKINTIVDDLAPTKEETQLQEDIDDLPEDVQEALGLEDQIPLESKKNTKTPAPDLDYLPEDEKNALEEIDELF